MLRISRKRKPSEYTYSISDAPISITDSHKDMGVVVSSNLKWSVHIADCTSKANRMLGFLRRNCAQMTDVRSRRLLYIALVRSHLSYASEVWAPQSSGRDLALLKGVQRRATKFSLPDYELPYRLIFFLSLTGLSSRTFFSFLNSNRAILTLTFLSI